MSTQANAYNQALTKTVGLMETALGYLRGLKGIWLLLGIVAALLNIALLSQTILAVKGTPATYAIISGTALCLVIAPIGVCAVISSLRDTRPQAVLLDGDEAKDLFELSMNLSNFEEQTNLIIVTFAKNSSKLSEHFRKIFSLTQPDQGGLISRFAKKQPPFVPDHLKRLVKLMTHLEAQQ